MTVQLTIRDVPNDVRDELAARAARAGQSLQEYLRTMLVAQTAHPTAADVLARARARVRATGSVASAATILESLDADRR